MTQGRSGEDDERVICIPAQNLLVVVALAKKNEPVRTGDAVDTRLRIKTLLKKAVEQQEVLKSSRDKLTTHTVQSQP